MFSSTNETASVGKNEQNIVQSNLSESNTKEKSVDKLSDANNLDKNQRPIIINKFQPLARCSVLYLGTAIPSEDERGIDSIQEPLSKRYPIDGTGLARGIEAWLSIDENGLQIQFPKDPSVMIYYPIRSLTYVATIRFITRTEADNKFPNSRRFIPLDFPEADQIEDTQNPPLFVVTFHRTRHLPIDECHCFVAKTKQSALELVQACFNAYQATDSEQDCSKVPLYFKINEDGSNIKEIDDEICVIPALDEEQTLDFQINKKTAGYFYKTDQISIDYWHLWEQQKQDNQSLNSSDQPIREHRLSSITSIPETQKLPESQSTNNSSEQLSQPSIDPFAPDPNVLRVERIKDVQTGRDIFIRWLRTPSEVSEQIPITQTPDYDSHVDSQSEGLYSPDPNVLRVERIKDNQSGRDIFIRSLPTLSEVSEQIPTTQTLGYNFHVDSQSEGLYAPDPNAPRVERIQDNQSGRDIFIRSLPTLSEVSEQIPTTQTLGYDFHVDSQSEGLYAPDPNDPRVERIKDNQSGRDIVIRWVPASSEVSKQIPITQTPGYDVYVDYNINPQSEEQLTNEVQNLVLDDKVLKKSAAVYDEPQSIPIPHYEHKKSKKKHKHRDYQAKNRHEKKRSAKIHKHHRHEYTEVVNFSTPPPPPIQQVFTIPSYGVTYHTLQLASPPNSSAPFWFYTM